MAQKPDTEYGEKPDSRVRKLLRWRLRYVLLAFLLVAFTLGWLTRERSQIQSRRNALESIGTTVGFSSSQPYWHRVLFGPDPRYYVLGFQARKMCDDVALAQLEGLDHLESLILFESKVTDGGLTQLKKLPRLHTLDLGRTAVSDAGVKHLIELQLIRIDVTDTKVTKAGITKLAHAFPGMTVLPIP